MHSRSVASPEGEARRGRARLSWSQSWMDVSIVDANSRNSRVSYSLTWGGVTRRVRLVRGGGTRRVQLVREGRGGGGGGTAAAWSSTSVNTVASASPASTRAPTCAQRRRLRRASKSKEGEYGRATGRGNSRGGGGGRARPAAGQRRGRAPGVGTAGHPPPPPPPGTKWTRCVPHPVLIGHAASLTGAAAQRHEVWCVCGVPAACGWSPCGPEGRAARGAAARGGTQPPRSRERGSPAAAPAARRAEAARQHVSAGRGVRGPGAAARRPAPITGSSSRLVLHSPRHHRQRGGGAARRRGAP